MKKGQDIDPDQPLTLQEETFVSVYVKTFNATEAAMQAFNPRNRNVGRTIGSIALARPNVKKAVKAWIKERKMEADENLTLLADTARADLSQFVVTREVKIGRKKVLVQEFDLAALRDAGLGHLVKGIRQTKYGQQIEFHDAMKARELIGRHLGLFTDRVITVDVSKLTDEQLEQIINGGDKDK